MFDYNLLTTNRSIRITLTHSFVSGVLMLALLLSTLLLSPISQAQIIPNVGELRYFEDSEESLDIKSVRHSLINPQTDKSIDWIYPESAVLSLGFVASPHWFTWTVKRSALAGREISAKGNYLLEVPFPSIDHLDVWIYDEHQRLLLEETAGDSKPFQTRKIPSRKFLFDFPWDASAELTIVMRVQTTDTLRFASKLWPTDEYWLSEEKQGRWHGIYFGVITAMLLYNLSLAAGVREKAFYYYVLWIPLMSLAVATDLGYSYELLWPNNVYWNDRAYSLLNALGAGFAVLFFGNALSITRKNNPKETNFLIMLATMSILTAIACLLIPAIYTLQLTSIVGATIICLLVFFAAERMLKADLQAGLLLLAFSIVAIGGTIRILNNFGLISSLANAELYLEIGTGVEVILLSLFLSSRVYSDRRKRSEAQNELIALQKTMYSDLEKIVDERTAELASLNKLLAETSVTDPLTSLKNRRYFDENIDKLMDFSARADTGVGILMIDLDHFKQINDNYGHQIGDDCLTHFANILRSVVKRDSDIVARYGGEEFIVALANCSKEIVLETAEKIRSEVEKMPLITKRTRVDLSCSIGASFNRKISRCDIDKLIKEADQAVYKAKNNGRNQVASLTEWDTHAKFGNTWHQQTMPL